MQRSISLLTVLVLCVAVPTMAASTNYTISTFKNGQSIATRQVKAVELRNAAAAMITAFQDRAPNYAQLVRLYAVSCGTQQSHLGLPGPPAATLPPALPASGKGASRPLPSGLPTIKVMADNPLASFAGQAVVSRPSPSGALRAALTRLPDPGCLGRGGCCIPHETTRGPLV